MNRSTGTVRPRFHCAHALPGMAATRRIRSYSSGGFALTLALTIGATTSSAAAGIITEKAFFTGKDTTVIDFETDGDGAPISLSEGQSQSMPASEYASQGIVFDSPIAWVNDGAADFDAAQFLGGSPTVAIPGSGNDLIALTFTETVRAFGFFVANNSAAGSSAPMFIARDAEGAALETVTFSAPFIDGTVGVVDYGFMGIVTETPIASVEISKDAAIFDDLHMSPIPGPGPVVLIGMGAGLLFGGRRRNR